jgi:hypothetical protein
MWRAARPALLVYGKRALEVCREAAVVFFGYHLGSRGRHTYSPNPGPYSGRACLSWVSRQEMGGRGRVEPYDEVGVARGAGQALRGR